MTVQDLRDSGYKVKVLHNRLYDGFYKWQVGNHKNINTSVDPDPKGGSTTLIIDSPSGDHFEGHSTCSKLDNYDKKLGVRIAIGRSGILEYIYGK